jgi:hypothetical protein
MSTITITPARSLEQRLDALAEANRIRTRRAVLKRDVAAGRETASRIVYDVPDWAGTMKVYELLMTVPRWGRTKSLNAMRAVDIAAGKTIGGLSPRQRLELLGRLAGR